jgi:hypothetical protein
MRPVSYLLIATVALFTACVDLPDESTTSANVLSANRIGANRIGANRIGANRLPASRLATTQLSTGQLAVNMQTAGKILETAESREVFSLIVSCAMPPGLTLSATVGEDTFLFPGEMGLALGWLLGPLDLAGQGWVSACMLARINANDIAFPISMRGPNPSLGMAPGEREIWSIEEGAFFGNLFGPLDQDIQWYACRGAGQASGEFGGLTQRDCAEPDPDAPGLTQCGFNFVGDCGTFATTPACEQFSGAGTFYARCHTGGTKVGADVVFQQVITAYVIP